MIKALITGANGQVGWELQRTVPQNISILALDSTELNITNHTKVNQAIQQFQPDVLINAAAYTAVDKAEEEQEKAFSVNATGTGILAEAAHNFGIRLIHLSTDFVFDGRKSSPYLPEDTPNPINVYGASKLEGEKNVRKTCNDQALILRTGWVYSAHGHNFVKTMLRLMKERDQINVVGDQVGTPTWANGLAKTIWKFTEVPDLYGIYHWSDAGLASWYDFAVLIQEKAIKLGILKQEIPIEPIRSQDYMTAALRPSYSVLDKSQTWLDLSIQPQHWGTAMNQMLFDFSFN